MSAETQDTLVIETRLAELARVERWLAGLLQDWKVSPETRFAVDLVINEAVTNVIGYAHPEDPTRETRISLTDRPDAIVVEILDTGTAFNPLEAPAMIVSKDLDEASIGGRGIHLIKSFADNYSYSRVSGHNHLTLAIHKKG
ncbi:ATP-binding protein [Thiocapsa sp.]|uniref:ATP-binding protein n=1 Tax=Thiocapsa sp. TaxID=2024551 RepID=UPI0025F6692C|nr:ATP-binding protein [Thiocapsa sp.]